MGKPTDWMISLIKTCKEKTNEIIWADQQSR